MFGDKEFYVSDELAHYRLFRAFANLDMIQEDCINTLGDIHRQTATEIHIFLC